MILAVDGGIFAHDRTCVRNMIRWWTEVEIRICRSGGLRGYIRQGPRTGKSPGLHGYLKWCPTCRKYRLVCSSHPVVLASIARHLVHGQVEGARQGYRTVRTELAEWVPPHARRRRAHGLPSRRPPAGIHRAGRRPRGASPAR